MSNIVIKVEDVSKMYRLGTLGSGSLVSDVNRFIAKIRGKEDPYSIVGTNDRTSKADSEYIWSLKDINFDIKQGDAVGIIGRNGAGKSTLLKILSRVTAPTTGTLKIKGRVASLLEVGTGFHPELSGRDNIFMNGAILGMSRAEIRSKFDEIVDFAGVEKYIDTPVKRYSSGMYVRLAFAVAAHLEPDILIVDEVLAVGDAEFQTKCLGKMREVNNKEGRTVLFVSHNMGAIYSLTSKAIYLKQGFIDEIGDTNTVVNHYQTADIDATSNEYEKKESKSWLPIEFNKIQIKQVTDTMLKIVMEYEVKRNVGSVVAVKITNVNGVVVTTIRDTDLNENVFSKTIGTYVAEIDLDTSLYMENKYKITFSTSDMKSERYDYLEDCLTFETIAPKLIVSNAIREGVMLPIVPWFQKKIN